MMEKDEQRLSGEYHIRGDRRCNSQGEDACDDCDVGFTFAAAEENFTTYFVGRDQCSEARMM